MSTWYNGSYNSVSLFLKLFSISAKSIGESLGPEKRKKKESDLRKSDNSDQCVKTAAHLSLDPQKECKLVITRKVGLS